MLPKLGFEGRKLEVKRLDKTSDVSIFLGWMKRTHATTKEKKQASGNGKKKKAKRNLKMEAETCDPISFQSKETRLNYLWFSGYFDDPSSNSVCVHCEPGFLFRATSRDVEMSKVAPSRAHCTTHKTELRMICILWKWTQTERRHETEEMEKVKL